MLVCFLLSLQNFYDCKSLLDKQFLMFKSEKDMLNATKADEPSSGEKQLKNY